MKLDTKIKNHFQNTSEFYSKRKGIVHDEDPTILNFIKKTCTVNSKVLEIGGGSGYMLDLIESKTGIEQFYNCEIVPEVYKKQVNEKIELIGGNALYLPFKNNNFDYVILKNLLHHLVGKTRKKSYENANVALDEITRVAKDGSYIIILEQYNKYKFFASIVFYITLFFSTFNFRIYSFGWNKYVIVSFLTPNEIKDIVRNDILIERIDINRAKVNKRLKFTLLMAHIGRVLLIGRCNKISEDMNL